METISIIGATGALGSGLAVRWAEAGYPVIIGSRDSARAVSAAGELNARVPGNLARGMGNADAAAAGDIVVLTVKFAHQRDTLEQIRDGLNGKILVDTTVPLVPPKVARVQLPPEGSAALVAQAMLGDDVRIVSAFQNVAASVLAAGERIECDVLVTGDDVKSREKTIELAEAAGMCAWHAGPLVNSVAAEALTSVLIHINKRYRSDHTGITISGVSANHS
jgi:NADPH-dependent F420 reductase